MPRVRYISSGPNTVPSTKSASVSAMAAKNESGSWKRRWSSRTYGSTGSSSIFSRSA